MGGLGAPGVIRPRMLRIPPLHLLLHLGVGRVPEVAQVGRHLQGLAARRQQVQQHRHATIGHARRIGQAEQLLQLHRQHGWLAVRVFDAALHARRHGDPRRRERVDTLALRPVEARLQRVRQLVFAQRIQAGLAGEGGLQPVIERRHQRVVGQVRQAEVRHPVAQAAHAFAPLPQRFGPRQRVQAQVAHRVGQRCRGKRRIDAPGRPRIEHDLVEARFALRRQRTARCIPAHGVLGDETVGEVAPQAPLVHGYCALHQRIACFVAQLTDDDPWLTDQGAVVEQPRAASIRQQVATRVLRMLEADAVREGMHQQVAQAVRFHRGRRRGGLADAASPLLRGGVDRGQARTVRVLGRAAVAECRQRTPARGQRVPAHAQRIARFDQRGEVARQRAVFALLRRQQHRGQSRMGAEREHALAQRRDGVRCRQRTEPAQQVARGIHRPGRQRIDEAQVVAAPRSQLQSQGAEFDQRDLRPSLRIEPLRLRPQAIRPAFGHATRTAGTLVGGSLRDVGHLQAREAAVRIVRRFPRQPAVDHHAHAGQRHRRLRHVGRQYHAAATLGIGLQGFGLLLHRQFAVQGEDDDVL